MHVRAADLLRDVAVDVLGRDDGKTCVPASRRSPQEDAQLDHDNDNGSHSHLG